MLLAIQSHV